MRHKFEDVDQLNGGDVASFAAELLTRAECSFNWCMICMCMRSHEGGEVRYQELMKCNRLYVGESGVLFCRFVNS